MLALAAPLLLFAAAADAHDTCDNIAAATLAAQARTAVAQRDFPSAIERAKSAAAACPGDVAIRLQLANTYFVAQRWSDAKAMAREVLRDAPGQPGALKIEANVDYLLGDFNSAQDVLIRVMEHHPNDAEAPYMLGRMYYQEAQIEQAIGQFERVLKLDPQAYKAYDNLGLCYQARGDTARAVRYFLESIKLVETAHPDYDWPYANLAALWIETGENRKAFDAAAKAAKRNPASARDFYLGGKALWNLQQTDLAIKWLRRSTELDPAYPEPLYLLARVYAQAGDKVRAAEARRKFLEAKAKAPAKRR